MNGAVAVQSRGRRAGTASHLKPVAVAGRLPPHDLDAEAAVLSAILNDRSALDKVLEVLKPEHFYHGAHGWVFEAAQELSLAGRALDTVTVASWLRDRERLVQIGGSAYLAVLADATPAVANVQSHAAIVREKWRLRQLIATCQRVAAEGYGDVGDAEAFIDGAEQSIYELARTSMQKSAHTMGEALTTALARIVAAAERRDRITGTSTGFHGIDALTAGLHDGEFTIVAGRPGMGKTAFVLDLAVNVASCGPDSPGALPHQAVLICSLEMPADQLAQRMACSEGRVDLGKVRQGMLTPEDWRRLTGASTYLAGLPIRIEAPPALGLLELRAKVRRFQAEFNRAEAPGVTGRRVGLVVVDYLQLMKGRDGAVTREQEVSELSRGLKQLANELGVPVIALSQLSRAVESRADKRPQLSDLRESGALEQDADTVIFIHRDEYYNPETSTSKGRAEAILAKQRNGPTGSVWLRFTASYTRFDNLEVNEVSR
ncbi:replicative DNA helicase [Chondromyces apiculatus]|uniref:Replicative DNA helicase n=1 Tax=Chondromyces apiculatus DSM 436 TaxID=1192034 RepID=A0A017TCQ2_9BACT|nr:replicative DNA helicase [Chondromyces apiculatus]EYF07038.1 Replicative DNA helicase [Chondromyces apiculatus DSM 436]